MAKRSNAGQSKARVELTAHQRTKAILARNEGQESEADRLDTLLHILVDLPLNDPFRDAWIDLVDAGVIAQRIHFLIQERERRVC